MPTKIKFLADEHIDLPAVEALKGKGTGIISVKDAGLLGYSDEKILKFANSQSRAIVTRDKDFLAMHSKGFEHFGIVFLTKQLDVGEIIKQIGMIEILFKLDDIVRSVLYIPLRH